MIHVREFVGKDAGPSFLVFGAIHGNEVCGTRALEKIAHELDSGILKLKKGRLSLVPKCNEKAVIEGKRYIDTNLNRIFHPHDSILTHEHHLANHLAPLVARCDYFLDLHSMQSKGAPFAFLNRLDPHSEALCRALGVSVLMKGWPELYEAFPDIVSCCTQTYADRLKKPNALIECGTNGSPEADEFAYEATLRAMAHLDLIDSRFPAPTQKIRALHLKDLYFREHEGDEFVKAWVNFEPIRKGELIGHRGRSKLPVLSPRDGVIVFPSPVSALGTEWFYVAVEER